MMLLATCCEDDIVPHVLPFVKDNIKDADWRHRLNIIQYLVRNN